MDNYLSLLKQVMEKGIDKEDRTGTGVRWVFGAQMRFDLNDGFPLVTTKKTFLRGIVVELIWLIRWETNIKYLVDRNVKIWDEWPFQNYIDSNNLWEKFPKYSDAWMEEKKRFIEKISELPEDDEFVQKWWDLGPVYGQQWRNFNGPHPSPLPKGEGKRGVDQLKNAIDLIKNDPTSRRIIVNAWNPAQIDEMLLPPCHMFYQLNVDTTNNKLNLHMYQRSADLFLGVPFNIASYSTLLMLLAKITWLEDWEYVHCLWDAHIYNNHFDQVNEQLSREPFGLPELKLKKDVKTLEDLEKLEWGDFELVWYESHGRISAPVAV